MFTNRFVLGVLSLLLVIWVVSQSRSNTPQAVDLSWPPRPDSYHLSGKPLASIPDTDFYQRHPELRMPAVTSLDLTDYINRHPELSASTEDALAVSDYFMRHPELTISVDASADLTDYFFRQEWLSSGSSVDLTDYFFRHP
jgi:hypothetical protein